MGEDKVIRSTCGICHIGCGILVHVDDGQVIKIEGDPENPLNQGILCPKGPASAEYLYHPDRLEHPLKRLGRRGEGKWQPISWDEALSTIANELAKARNRYSAESVAFIRGGAKGLQDDYFTRFANIFGSPNVTGMAHVCAIPRRNASRITYGFPAVPDLDYPPASILIWGEDAGETLHFVHRRLLAANERGAKLIVIDPMKTSIMDRADLWLKPRPGSDLALALGMLNVIINESLYDSAFVERWTVGFDQLRKHVQDYPPEKVADVTWLSAEEINKAARFYATSKPACILWGNAIDQGVNSFQTARALCILRAITGNLEVPGGELRWSRPPIVDRGSSEFGLHEKISPEVRQWRITAGERTLPMALYALPQGIFQAMRYGAPYPVRAAYLQGCNALLSHSNAKETYQALLQLDFLAVTDMFMTPTASLADIVLPAATYLEYDSIAEPLHFFPVVLVQQKITRLGECRSDYEILRDLARKLDLGEYFWDTEEQCLDFILAPAGITFDEFKNIGFLKGTKEYRTYQTKGFPTPSSKVEIYSERLKEWGFDPLPAYYEPPETPFSTPELTDDYPFVMTSRRCTHYRHSGGRQISSLRSTHPNPIVSIHPETAQRLGIGEGDWAYIETRRGRMKQKITLAPEIDPRVVVVEYGWWFPEEGPAASYGWDRSNVNILTDDQPPFNREMGSTNLRGILCRVYKVSVSR